MTEPGDAEMFQQMAWPFADDSFPVGLGAVVQRTVLSGEASARLVIHDSNNNWLVGDGQTDPNLPNACELDTARAGVEAAPAHLRVRTWSLTTIPSPHPVLLGDETEEGAVDDEASGHEADFRRYVAGRQRALLRTAWLLTGDWGTAEDLVQTALVRAWPHWRRIGGGGPGADAYVRRIMVNKATDWRSRRWRGEVPTEPLPDLPTALGRSRELHELLVDALRTLPPRQRTAVVLRYFDDLTEAATAEAMGCAVGTVKSQTARGLAALRRHPALSELELEGSAS